MLDLNLQKAKSYAYKLIDCGPRSESEFRERLRKKGHSEEVIETIAADFKKEGLIGDKNFAKLWIETRSQNSPKGIALIRLELISKGVDKELVDETIEELKGDFDEAEKARELLRKRLRSVEGIDKKKAKARLFGYLRRRGFSSDVIWKVLNETY